MADDGDAGKTQGKTGGDANGKEQDQGQTQGDGGKDQGTQGDAGKDEPLRAEGQQALEAFKQRARNAERELKTTKDRLDALESEKLSDSEKKDKRIEELEGKLSSNTTAVQDAFLRAAIADSEHKVANVADTAVLLRQAGVEFDDNHQPQDLDTRLKELLDAKPHLRAAGTQVTGDGDGGAGDGAAPANDMNARIRAKLRGQG